MKRFYRKYGIWLEIAVFFLAILYFLGRHVENAQTVAQGEISDTNGEDEDYIKWVEFNVTAEALNKAYELDVETYGDEVHLNWVELLAYLGTSYGGDFKKYKASDMDELANKLTIEKASMAEITADMEHYSYYLEAYTAVLGGLVGEYEIEALVEDTTQESEAGSEANKQNVLGTNWSNDENPQADDQNSADIGQNIEMPKKVWQKKYGLKGFNPVCRGYDYSASSDFGNSRSYGYKRKHLGHDMFGQTGTPITAVESGYVEAIGWNQYGGWRLGIRSFDKKRYYYYAHLRQNFPYNKSLKEGSVVTAGDVIGYMGHTGYSTTENVNNIKSTHLHWGLQLIFDESQKEGTNEIWINCTELTKFLRQKRCTTVKDPATKEYSRVYQMRDPLVEEYNEYLEEPEKNDKKPK